MNINNMELADKVSQFVKMRLLDNQSFIRENDIDSISAEEALGEFERIKSLGINSDYQIEYTRNYEKLRHRCSGTISFTSEEIKEITETLKDAIETCGLSAHSFYWDVIAFSVDRLEKFINSKFGTLKTSEITNPEYNRLSRMKRCLQLTQAPSYYKPYSAIISCVHPQHIVSIVTDEDGVVYQVDSTGNALVDRVTEVYEDHKLVIAKDTDDVDKAVNVATDWWVKALTDPTFAIRYDIQASYISLVMAICHNMFGDRLSPNTIERLRESLEKQIRIGIEKEGNFVIKTGQEFDPTLKKAMNDAQISDLDFPLRTSMNISPERVFLVIGGNKDDKVVLYNAKKETKAPQKKLGTMKNGE